MRVLLGCSLGGLGHLPEAAAVYGTALDAAGELPARVLMTTGTAIDPSALGPVAPNTHIERWVPRSDVLPHSRLVVCHGGSGTVFAALAAGLPLVVCPLFADQSANGRLVEHAGAGVVLEAQGRAAGALGSLGESDVDPLRGAIELVLNEPSHREGAETVAAEIGATPALEDVLAQLLAARCPSRRARSS